MANEQSAKTTNPNNEPRLEAPSKDVARSSGLSYNRSNRSDSQKTNSGRKPNR